MTRWILPPEASYTRSCTRGGTPWGAEVGRSAPPDLREPDAHRVVQARPGEAQSDPDDLVEFIVVDGEVRQANIRGGQAIHRSPAPAHDVTGVKVRP